MDSVISQESPLNKTIIRSAHDKENPYVMIRRAVPQDERLSWEARGVMAYLLSKPDNWVIQANNLRQHCGRDKVYSILKELTETGYLERVQWVDEQNKFTSFEYHLHEVPLTEKPEADSRLLESRTPGNQHHTDNRDSELNKDSFEPTVLSEPPIQFPERRPPFSANSYEGPGSPSASKKGKRIMGREGGVVPEYEPKPIKVNPITKPSSAPGRPVIVPKPAKPRNLVFDAVGLYCFGLTEDKVNSIASTIGQWKKALTAYLGETMINENPAGVVDTLKRWDNWYVASNKPGWDKPGSVGKFIKSLNEGAAVNFGIGQAANSHMVDDPDNPGTPIHRDLLAQRQEAEQAFKARYGDKS